ncbi:MAG: PD-(D/E)XK nuclease family protein [Campylobacterota bacterium]|nr:PD-(D/E)XK nuclease family protein [Campylobacterota bacterium]
MDKISKKIYITYSNQKVRDLKADSITCSFDKVITLDKLIVEIFESKNFEFIIDEMIASSIIYKIIQEENIEYFSYLNNDSLSLTTIYKFIMRSKRNVVPFDELLCDDKLEAIIKIDKSYQNYKKENSLVDISDIEESVLKSDNSSYFDSFEKVLLDCFEFGNINYVKSKMQEKILEKFDFEKMVQTKSQEKKTTKLLKPSNDVFDNIDEVKTAIRIARKLMQEGIVAEEILIVASDIAEYAPLYKLFLDEYEMRGYSSMGTPLNSFHNTKNPKVQIALRAYKAQIESLNSLYKKLGITLSDSTKDNIKASISIQDERVGIELTEPNQLVGLRKKYKHIIFVGTDINHFPPKANNNFLYSYDDDIKYFYANNYFTSSQTQLNELKRLSENLYIITASYMGKRELTPSILIDKKFDDSIDISDIKSVNSLALNQQTTVADSNTKNYYESIISKEFTPFDGDGVLGCQSSHLSASQINRYISCPLAYLYTNKVKIKSPSQNEEGFDVMEQGSLMHLCYELFGRYIKSNGIKTKDKEELDEIMYQISIEAYNHEQTTQYRGEENIHHQIFLKSLQAGLLPKFVDYYIEKADEFKHFENSEFEKEFALDSELKPYKLQGEDDENYFIKGFIDRFDNLETQINIIDYKSKAMKSKIDKQMMNQIKELQDVQLSLYILYASQEYEEKNYLSHLLSFKGDGKYFHFANLSSVEGLKDTIHYTQEHENQLKELIYNTKEKIQNGEFIFNNSDEKICGYCDIKHICHESVLGKGV